MNLPAADPARAAAAPTALAAPPVPPGQLTVAPTDADVLAYLERLARWIDELRAELDRLDADATLASDPDTYTPDITLAMSLRQAIGSRYDELSAVWDSGRVGRDELARIAVLLWGRLHDPLGGASAFTLTEAATLAAALTDRLAAALAADAVAGSGVAGRVALLQAALRRCRSLAEVVGTPTGRIDALGAQLAAALASKDRTRVVDAVGALDPEIAVLERDLIKASALRAGTARLAEGVRTRGADLQGRLVALDALVARCRSRIAGLAEVPVPTVATLEDPPAAPADATTDTEQWATARAALERYSRHLDDVARAADAAEAHYGAPLRSRDDLRGLLGAYATRAARSGLAEDPVVTTAFRAAHDVLWSAPCDLEVAARLVEAYQQVVRIGTGAVPASEPTGPRPAGRDDIEGERS